MAAQVTSDDATIDGRRLRREQNREAVLTAMGELFAEGLYQPNVNEIAERAGLSPRSLFRYFDDVDDLHRATIERQLAAARPLLEVGVTPTDPTDVKVRGLVTARCRLHEATIAPAKAARAGAARHRLIAAQVHESRSYLRHQIDRLFEAELADRPGISAAVDALCSFETYDLLRTDRRMTKAAVVDALTSAVGELVGP